VGTNLRTGWNPVKAVQGGGGGEPVVVDDVLVDMRSGVVLNMCAHCGEFFPAMDLFEFVGGFECVSCVMEE